MNFPNAAAAFTSSPESLVHIQHQDTAKSQSPWGSWYAAIYKVFSCSGHVNGHSSATNCFGRSFGEHETRPCSLVIEFAIERHDPCTPLGGSLTHPPLSGPEPILPTCQLASQMIPDSQQELKGARIGSKWASDHPSRIVTLFAFLFDGVLSQNRLFI